MLLSAFKKSMLIFDTNDLSVRGCAFSKEVAEEIIESEVIEMLYEPDV